MQYRCFICYTTLIGSSFHTFQDVVVPPNLEPLLISVEDMTESGWCEAQVRLHEDHAEMMTGNKRLDTKN